MTRDPRNLDQNPLVIDPANVDAVLNDRPTPASPALKPAQRETTAEYAGTERIPDTGKTEPTPKR